MSYRFILSAIFAITLPLTAVGQNAPTRIIVPFTAGGATDTLARGLASRLSEAWDRPVVVENKPGAAGTIGSRQVALSSPDGNTLLIVASGHATNELVHEKLPYKTLDDFTPIAQIVDVPNVLLVPKNSPYQNVMQLIAASKEAPDLLSYGTSGIGTSVHLAGELFKAMSGAKMEPVFFKGDSESLSNVVGEHVPVSVNTVPGAKGQIDAGKVRALAVTSQQRVPILEDTPTISEAGVPGYEVSTWFGILGPKGMDPDEVKRINADIRTAMTNTEVVKQLSDRGMIVKIGSPSDFDQLIRNEIDKWRPIIGSMDMRGKN
ncbi:ABC transporter substrate-binding protein [Pollutimonas nitritireducens]|uniref:ABC transporter substrate-binding protein n=1 Tax=Pollutimonas nitritireducens TaxID=2045209 RepID=A0A2N4ULM7_9BURK|nr:tripartite tricarboxylate transporter substrate binding protein [Pollutimonas nitritireducens]PLC55898.1 ABC transporter substrate-binding protein [Pollutimonas nitritireducens]